jgi:hypothetical protein
MKQRLLLLILTGFMVGAVLGQTVPQKDMKDILRTIVKNNLNSFEVDSFERKKTYLNVLPVIGYSPPYGFLAGAGVSLNRILGNTGAPLVSSALVNVSVTTKNQTIFIARSNVYLPGGDWILQGDWRILFFSQPTYGTGIYFGGTDRPLINGNRYAASREAQYMDFNYIRFYQTVYRRLNASLYAGLGIAVDHHFNIRDLALDLASPQPNYTAHYLNNLRNNFPLNRTTANGLTLNLLWDSRDNPINTYEGWYAQLGYRMNTALLGSNSPSQVFTYDVRFYLHPDKTKRENILAIWNWGQLLTNGKLPYLAMPSIAWDTYNRSGRGYIQGRFRGENMMYSEAEYRFPITRNRLLGGVVFVNGTTASGNLSSQPLLHTIALGYGAGLRVKMSKKTRTNVTVDLGLGQKGASAIFINLQEFF